ncbi:MAG TPA: 4Fe-4S dicluster domain-containing protein [Dehalococcoidales bacterium]|nr:4Fe-4S dicluster domain-containing protein [Dehalococcoidales bacterium]
MCEFCHKHGEGKKWYLQAKNYSQDLQSDLMKRRVFDMNVLGRDLKRLEELKKAPFFVRAIQEPRVSERVRNMHFGQVLPIEDVEQIFGFVNNVVRLDCICRKTKNVKEQRYCYGISVIPQGEEAQKVVNQPGSGFLSGAETLGLEKVSKEEALERFREHEKEGLCHSVWTQLTPFIVGICNCDRSDCGAMQATLVKGTPMMFRAEYVAELNPELCNGCRACMRVCQFGAIGYSAGNKKAFIDIGRCYGCGICRASCTKDAIHLHDRASVPAVANLW